MHVSVLIVNVLILFQSLISFNEFFSVLPIVIGIKKSVVFPEKKFALLSFANVDDFF